MLVEIDTNVLIENKITANQFLLAYLLHAGDINTLQNLMVLGYDIDELVENGFIHNGNELDSKDSIDFTKLVLKTKFENLIVTGDFFDELVQGFPVKVRRKDGTEDYLRSDLARCRKLYNKITKHKKLIHTHILSCLVFEVNYRVRNNNLAYMKKLPKWLASEEWKVYEQFMLEDTNKEEEVSYGTELI
jgi:hypothetical protein